VCKDKRQGEKLLNTLLNSHEYCGCCGTRLKEVEPPKPESAFDVSKGAWNPSKEDLEYQHIGQEESQKSAIGFEYATENADYGLKTTWSTKYLEGVTHGIVCGNCGNASLFDPQEDIRKDHLFEHASRILDSLRERKKDGEFETAINEAEVFRVLTEVPDLTLAVGIARE